MSVNDHNQLTSTKVDNSEQLVVMIQGIIDCKGTELRQFFFHMFVSAKKIKELFASTLNGIG